MMRFVAPGLYPAIVGSTPTGCTISDSEVVYMVNLTDIRAENGIVYARAENLSNGIVENVIAYEDGSYTNAEDYNICKAIWGLVVMYKGKKKGYPKKDNSGLGLRRFIWLAFIT